MIAVLVLGVVLVATTGGLLAATARPSTAVSYLLGTYLAGWATVVLSVAFLSAMGWLGRAGLLTTLVLALASAIVVWSIGGRPRPPVSRSTWVKLGRTLNDPVLALLAFTVFAAFAYAAVLGVARAPAERMGFVELSPDASGLLAPAGLRGLCFRDRRPSRQREPAGRGDRPTRDVVVEQIGQVRLAAAVLGGRRPLPRHARHRAPPGVRRARGTLRLAPARLPPAHCPPGVDGAQRPRGRIVRRDGDVLRTRQGKVLRRRRGGRSRARRRDEARCCASAPALPRCRTRRRATKSAGAGRHRRCGRRGGISLVRAQPRRDGRTAVSPLLPISCRIAVFLSS